MEGQVIFEEDYPEKKRKPGDSVDFTLEREDEKGPDDRECHTKRRERSGAHEPTPTRSSAARVATPVLTLASMPK